MAQQKPPSPYDIIKSDPLPTDVVKSEPLPDAQKPSGGSRTGSFLGGVWDSVNPLPLLQMMAGDVSDAVSGKTDPRVAQLVRGLQIMAPVFRVPGAVTALSEGRYKDAANEFSASIPLLGPAAEQASNLTKSSDPNERARGYGQITGMVGSSIGGEAAVAGTARGMARAANTTRRALTNPNPVEAAALKFVQDKGVPVDAGTMTGNAFLRGATLTADRTLGGSVVANRAANQQAVGLKATLGEHLANRASASTATAESAGLSTARALEQNITKQHAIANQSYDALRQMEAANVQSVITGHRTVASASGILKPQKVPTVEKMGFPVQLANVKAALRPLYDRMMKQMPEFQRKASKGLLALENLINGPDVAPASVVDADLSVIKSIARGADMPELRDLSQGIAAKAVGELDAAVQKAVSGGGPKAIAALQEGRRATRAKYVTSELLDQLRDEPVKAFGQATAPRDTMISQLRDLAREAPKEMQTIGRAYLDEMLARATSDGGFKGGARLANDWDKLGPQTKQILFGHADGLVGELDKFFLAVRRLSENPNPSGTASQNFVGAQLVGGGAAGGAALLGQPFPLMAFGLGQLTATGLAKALRSPSTLRILTQGMQAKPNTATGALMRQTILRLNQQQDEKKP